MIRSIILAATALTMFSGCNMVTNSMRTIEKNSIWNPVDSVADKKKKTSEESLPPVTMAAIWNFGTFEKPGSPSVRGLGGRIYFYDAHNNAVKADGELLVYGFDEDSGSRSKPDKKFVFRASELQSHYSESALGGSYSVWIPWDKVGGYRKSVTLLPIFKPTDGSPIEAEQSINLLAGRPRNAEDTGVEHPYHVLGSSSAVLDQPSDKNATSSHIKQASYNGDASQATANGSRVNSNRIQTTAISLTPNLRRQVELAAQVRNGQTPFSTPKNASQGSPTPQPSYEPNTSPPASRAPAARTSSSQGIFGAPGSFR